MYPDQVSCDDVIWIEVAYGQITGFCSDAGDILGSVTAAILP
jgi:hypothetical protein